MRACVCACVRARVRFLVWVHAEHPCVRARAAFTSPLQVEDARALDAALLSEPLRRGLFGPRLRRRLALFSAATRGGAAATRGGVAARFLAIHIALQRRAAARSAASQTGRTALQRAALQLLTLLGHQVRPWHPRLALCCRQRCVAPRHAATRCNCDVYWSVRRYVRQRVAQGDGNANVRCNGLRHLCERRRAPLRAARRLRRRREHGLFVAGAGFVRRIAFLIAAAAFLKPQAALQFDATQCVRCNEMRCIALQRVARRERTLRTSTIRGRAA
jgi:hypothetical protein